MGSISFNIPSGSTARAEVAHYVRRTVADEVVLASNYAPGAGEEWGGVYFAAHRAEDKQVWASITLFAESRGHVFIKMMDESMGPTAHGVGKTVLAALTEPRDDHYAQDWRAEAREYQAQRQAALAAKGTWINLSRRARLGSGEEFGQAFVEGLLRWRTPAGTLVRPAWDWFTSAWSPAAGPVGAG